MVKTERVLARRGVDMQVHIPMHSVEPVGSVTVWLKTVIQYDENIMSNEVIAVKLSTRASNSNCPAAEARSPVAEPQKAIPA